jgi:hypothetical protein
MYIYIKFRSAEHAEDIFSFDVLYDGLACVWLS